MIIDGSARKAINEYKGNLKKIVEQLEWCGYKNEASVLVNNVAFIALKEMANEENKDEVNND